MLEAKYICIRVLWDISLLIPVSNTKRSRNDNRLARQQIGEKIRGSQPFNYKNWPTN